MMARILMIGEARNSVAIGDVGIDRSWLLPIIRDGAFNLVQ